MTPTTLPKALRLAALSATLLLQTPAQAGLISGFWDPAFGAALPGLSWAVHAEVQVPNNNCTNLAGVQTLSGDCEGARLQAVFLRLYSTGLAAPDWSDPDTYLNSLPNAASFAVCDSALSGNTDYSTRCAGNYGEGLVLSALRIEGGSVAALQASVATIFTAPVDLANAQGNAFSLGFTLNGPALFCTTCAAEPIQSDTTGLRQFLVTYNSDNTSDPKFRDSSGTALGVRLDENGRVLGLATSIDGQLVPEPGGLALVATALAAAALVRRRRRG